MTRGNTLDVGFLQSRKSEFTAGRWSVCHATLFAMCKHADAFSSSCFVVVVVVSIVSMYCIGEVFFTL